MTRIVTIPLSDFVNEVSATLAYAARVTFTGAVPTQLLALLALVLGLMIGSFLNVVIARIPEGLSIVSPGSRCPKCGRPIRWYENVPVLSWLLLGRKCAGCKQPISIRYPAIELLTGLLFAGAALWFGWSWELLQTLVLISFLVPLTFIDLDHWLLPHELTWPGVVAGLLTNIPLGWPRLRDALIGAAVGYLAFWAMEWVGEKLFKKEALGGGDKNLLALIGAFLGYQVLLGVIFLSSLQGAVVGLILIAILGRAGPAAVEAPPEKKEADEDEDDWVPGPTNMPFGPWLALSALEMIVLSTTVAPRLPWPTSVILGAG